MAGTRCKTGKKTGPSLGLAGNERKDPLFRQGEQGVDAGRNGAGPAVAGDTRDHREDNRDGDAHADVGERAVQEDVPRLLQQEEHLAGDGEAGDVEEHALERLAGGEILGAAKGFGLRAGAVERGEDEEHHANRDAADAEDEQRVGRRDDFDVEPVGGVPPVVEGRGDEHRDASPGRDEGAERGAEAEHVDGLVAQAGGVAEGGVEDKVAADDGGDDSAGVDGDVRPGEKGVAADRAMPGDIPRAADRGRGDGGDARVDRPGDAGRGGEGAGARGFLISRRDGSGVG